MKKKPIIKMLVCCHKQDVWVNDDVYMPIHVGKSISNNNIDIEGDNTGDNISNKNKSYCELTGLYWAWKNLKDVDYIGLCHYRRYFNFNETGTAFSDFTIKQTTDLNFLNLTIPDVTKLFNKYDIVLAKQKHYSYNLSTDYGNCHMSEDLRIIIEIIIKKNPIYEKALNRVIYENNKLSHYNMFLLRWDDFDNYCTWLFDILNEAEKRIDISGYSDFQKRIWGYLSERLLNVYVLHHSMRVKRYPIYWINNDIKNISYLPRLVRYVKKNLAFFFCRSWINIFLPQK